MRKTLKDMAQYLKKLIPAEIPKVYAINPIFEKIADEKYIRKGILAFRDFLCRLCDRLIIEGDSYDKPKKDAHALADNTSIPINYPFLSNIRAILSNIGSNGVLSENSDSLLLNGNQSPAAGGNIFNLKLPDSKIAECLRFLTACGICIDGMDLSAKKTDISKLESLVISYPDNPAMLTGLKVLTIAQSELHTCGGEDVLLRCDYRALNTNAVEAVCFLKDTIRSLSIDIQNFILQLHQRCLDKGLKCVAEIMNFYIRFKYFYKSKELWRLNVSLNNGYNISIKANNTYQYADTIEKFPVCLQKKIAKGYGCGKKRGLTDSCDGGCRGFRIPLDDSIIEISGDIETWFDMELSCIK